MDCYVLHGVVLKTKLGNGCGSVLKSINCWKILGQSLRVSGFFWVFWFLFFFRKKKYLFTKECEYVSSQVSVEGIGQTNISGSVTSLLKESPSLMSERAQSIFFSGVLEEALAPVYSQPSFRQ